MRASPILATVDFEVEGEQHGFLKLPHSHDGSAWGAVMIPITVIKRGTGPTALLTGGVYWLTRNRTDEGPTDRPSS